MRLLLLNLLLIFSLTSIAQDLGNKINDSEKKFFETRVKERSKDLKSLDCKFTQEKKSMLISETSKADGILKYKDNSKLRWEYINPDPFALIINSNDVVVINNKNEKIKSDNIQKHLANFIINSINGNLIANNKDFEAEYYYKKNVFNIKLTPISAQFKQIFKYIIIELDKSNFVANSVIMKEQSDDETKIIFSDKKINEAISDSFFIIK